MAAKRHYSSIKGKSGMISDDASAPCFLPRNAMDKPWGSSNQYIGNGEADLFQGVEKQLKEDGSGLRRENKAKKY